MQVVDIGIGIAFAVASLSLIVMMNPYVPAQDVNTLNADMAARSAISSYLASHNLAFLSSAPMEAICSTAGNHGGAVVEITVDGKRCPYAPPSHYQGSSTLELQLPGRDVVLDSWYVGEEQ